MMHEGAKINTAIIRVLILAKLDDLGFIIIK